MVIDGHFHVWPDAIAAKALAGAPGNLRRFGDGTLGGAEGALKSANIDRAVCLAVAPTGAQVEGANRFAGSLSGKLVGFGSIHCDLTPDENLSSLRRHSLLGVKVHPIFQGYSLLDPRLWAIFEALEDEFVVIAHVGAAGQAHSADFCSPAMVAKVARAFPRLKLVACHFGGYEHLDDAERHVIGQNVWVDTAWPPSLGSQKRDRIRELIKRHGAERVCFASDWPMADPAVERGVIESLDLPSDWTGRILGGNLAELIGLVTKSS
jgi:predicted TIM-barrel fold metal-dependent hydrolase